MKRRRELDYRRFAQMSQEQSIVIELINGMQEIKMHNAEKQKRWSWEYVQARLFDVSLQSLSLEQTQEVGSSVINELKNIFITFTSALLVIEGNLTLGMMLSVQYIIGQLNSPITQLVGFIRAYQDASISLERLTESINDAISSKGIPSLFPFNINENSVPLGLIDGVSGTALPLNSLLTRDYSWLQLIGIQILF